MPSIDAIVKLIPERGSRKQVRSFGLVAGGGLLLIAVWPMLSYAAEVRQWAGVPGVLLVVLALVSPGVLQYPYRAWMLVGLGLGWINTRLIMAVVFYVVFTPVSILMRVTRRDTMHRAFDAEADTYRILRSARDPSHTEHPF